MDQAPFANRCGVFDFGQGRHEFVVGFKDDAYEVTVFTDAFVYFCPDTLIYGCFQ